MENLIVAIVLTVAFTTGLLVLFLRTFIKSTVEESIRHQFEVQREQLRQEFEREKGTLERKDKYRLVALEERLSAHQEAFALSRKLIHTLHDIEENKALISKQCVAFWDKRSLYLGNRSRIAFRDAWYAYTDYFMLKDSHRQAAEGKTDPEYVESTRKELFSAFHKIENLPKVLQEDIDLEAMGNEEYRVDGKKVNALGLEEKDNDK